MVIPQLSKLMLGVRFPLLAVAMAGRQPVAGGSLSADRQGFPLPAMWIFINFLKTTKKWLIKVIFLLRLSPMDIRQLLSLTPLTNRPLAIILFSLSNTCND